MCQRSQNWDIGHFVSFLELAFFSPSLSVLCGGVLICLLAIYMSLGTGEWRTKTPRM